MLTLTLLCQWRTDWLVAGFSSDVAVLDVASGFMMVVSWNFVATGLIFCCSGMFQATGNTLPSLAATATRLLTFGLPLLWLSGQPEFRLEYVWYLSAGTVWLQMALNLLLLRRQLARKLRFDVPSPRL
jgi:Na+-driven multidrug efflux pump